RSICVSNCFPQPRRLQPESRSTDMLRRDFLVGCGALTTALLERKLWADEPASVPAIDERIQKLAREAPLAMQFKGGTAEECRKWQAEFTTKLRSLLGPHA